MPNWSLNTLILTADKKTIGKFCETHLKDGEFDYNTFIPYPEDLEDKGMEWRYENWGCKWNATETRTSITETTFSEPKTRLMIDFESPWNPPLPVIVKMVDMYRDTIPVVHLSYWIYDVNLSGVVNFLEGEVVFDIQTEQLDDVHKARIADIRAKQQQ